MADQINEFDTNGKSKFQIKDERFPKEARDAFSFVYAQAKAQTEQDILDDADDIGRWLKARGIDVE